MSKWKRSCDYNLFGYFGMSVMKICVGVEREIKKVTPSAEIDLP